MIGLGFMVKIRNEVRVWCKGEFQGYGVGVFEFLLSNLKKNLYYNMVTSAFKIQANVDVEFGELLTH